MGPGLRRYNSWNGTGVPGSVSPVTQNRLLQRVGSRMQTVGA